MATDGMGMRDAGLAEAARGAGDWLCLAAAPTFALMALLAGITGGTPDMLCMAAPHASPWSGMAAMYALMSAFHTAPWLKLLARRRRSEII
jgi:hypothetical protein